MASDNKCPTLIKCYRGREETIIPEDGVPFLTGTKVLCWQPEALPTGISDSEGKRTEVAQGTHGEALVAAQVLIPAQISRVCTPEVHQLTLNRQFRSLQEETVGTGQK